MKRLFAAACLCAAACGNALADDPGDDTRDVPEDDAGVLVDGGGSDGAPLDPCKENAMPWRVRADAGFGALALALDKEGTHLFAGGVNGWLAELDPCSGTVLREKSIGTGIGDGGSRLTVRKIALGERTIALSGELSGGGAYYTVLDRATFGMLAEQQIGALGASSTPFNAVVDETSWFGGDRSDFLNPTGYFLHDAEGGCGVTRLGETLFGIEPFDAGVVVGYTAEGGAIALQPLGASCAPAAPAVPVLVAEAGTPFCFATAGDSFVVAQQLNMLDAVVSQQVGDAWVSTAPINDGTYAFDSVSRLASDGNALFVGGDTVGSWSPDYASVSGGSGWVARYALPLEAGAEPIWKMAPLGAELVWVSGIIPAPVGDGLFVSAYGTYSDHGVGGVMRCSKEHGCFR